MSTLLMNEKQHCGRRSGAPRRARGPLEMQPVTPLLTRLLVVVLVGGVLALLLGLSLTTRPSPPIAAVVAAPAAVAELPRVVVSGKRLAAPGRPVPAGTTSKDL